MSKRRYFEIIDTQYTGDVIGCCMDPNDADEEGHVFGEILKSWFDSYGDRPWTKPKSMRRYVLETQPKLIKRIN